MASTLSCSIKVNFDGAEYFCHLRMHGVGVIARDHERNFVAQLSKRFHNLPSPEVVELKAADKLCSSACI